MRRRKAAFPVAARSTNNDGTPLPSQMLGANRNTEPPANAPKHQLGFFLIVSWRSPPSINNDN